MVSAATCCAISDMSSLGVPSGSVSDACSVPSASEHSVAMSRPPFLPATSGKFEIGLPQYRVHLTLGLGLYFKEIDQHSGHICSHVGSGSIRQP